MSTTPAPSPSRSFVPPHAPTSSQRSRLTASLLAEAHRCTDADRRAVLLEQVVLLNRRIAEELASRYRNRGIPEEDLQQVAYEGLTRAVQRFDPTVRDDLLAFAVPTIRGQLRRYFRDQGWLVRPPRSIQELQARLPSVLERLRQHLGREPEPAEVARELGVCQDEYERALEAFGCFAPVSLDQPLAGDALTRLGDLLTTEDDIDAAEARLVLEPALRRLAEADRAILCLRFFHELSQDEIGRRLGLTQMQVSRRLTRLLTVLREALDDPAGEKA